MLVPGSRIEQVRVYGITTPAELARRVPTVAIRHAPPVAGRTGRGAEPRGIFVWHGNFYALPLTEALGLEPAGLVRIGLLHYNTPAEVDRLLAAIEELS